MVGLLMKLKVLVNSMIIFISFLLGCGAKAGALSQVLPYYGADFYSDLQSGASDQSLVYRIKTVLRSFHQLQTNNLDKILSSCEGQGRCYAHQTIGYAAARVWLMGGYYLKQDGDGYAVWDVYCNKYKGRDDFRRNEPSPGTVPSNLVVNVEHTWPQSRFNRRFSDEQQKSDLHHLFPADTKVNALRGNIWFGEVENETETLSCPESGSRYGVGSAGTEEVFEPPMEHKGHVARALFYFSVRYDSPIPPEEEVILKKWNREHPVDEDELRRNDAIFKAQGNRNPFVDYPDLADRIADF